ncbi:MAG: glycerol-3-phosphate 1-O-acyltransferase PlsY [Candidatus Rokubacteria bacterium]|nr:glycerol-3-phosphate 1-O-acyltransferase PlsY [Candidatus Rokubacteria bacterium]
MMVAWLLLAYLVGAIPVGYVVARALGVDIRRHGSGNIGATNVLRAVGRGPAIATLIGDVIKGYAGAWVGSLAGPGAPWAAAAAVLVIVGNCWPVFLRFRGGKGMATGLGAFLRVTPWALLPAAIVWLALVASFRYVSLASLCAALGLPLAIFLLGYPRPLAGAAAAVALIVIARHRENIERLLAGTERRLGQPEPART